MAYTLHFHCSKIVGCHLAVLVLVLTMIRTSRAATASFPVSSSCLSEPVPDANCLCSPLCCVLPTDSLPFRKHDVNREGYMYVLKYPKYRYYSA